MVYHFQPIAVEMLGPINGSASDFLSALAKKISQCSGDERETAFLLQRISVLMQRYNSILLHESFICVDCRSNGHSYIFLFYLIFSPNPSGSLIPRVKKIIIMVVVVVMLI